MDAAAAGICAAALSGVFIDIYPAAAEAFVKQCHIVLAEHSERFADIFLGLCKGNAALCVGYHRHIQIIHVKLVHL